MTDCSERTTRALCAAASEASLAAARTCDECDATASAVGMRRLPPRDRAGATCACESTRNPSTPRPRACRAGTPVLRRHHVGAHVRHSSNPPRATRKAWARCAAVPRLCNADRTDERCATQRWGVLRLPRRVQRREDADLLLRGRRVHEPLAARCGARRRSWGRRRLDRERRPQRGEHAREGILQPSRVRSRIIVRACAGGARAAAAPLRGAGRGRWEKRINDVPPACRAGGRSSNG
jgi:hypothetical protein